MKSVLNDLIPSIESENVPFHWKCANKKCKYVGGYDKNSINDKKCIICKKPAPTWECSFCSSTNKLKNSSCIACFSTKSDSIAHYELQQENFKIEQAELARLEQEKAREKEQQKVKEVKTKLEAMKAERDNLELWGVLNDIPEDCFIHPGSWIACGGNPTGFAKSLGSGLCTEPPEGCDRCGAGIAWSCCSSEDKDSKYCIQGQISKLQAERNAKLFSIKAEKKLSVLEMKGYFPTTTITEWICICTVANPLQSSTCSVCDSQKPEHFRVFDLETYESEWSELQSGEESLANKSVDQPESPICIPTSPSPSTPDSSFGVTSSFGVPSLGSTFGGPSPSFVPRNSSKADNKSSKDFPDLFVKCKSLHKVDSIDIGQKKKKENSRSRSRSRSRGAERCSFRGPKCTNTPVLYSCKLCSPISYMCRGCYFDEDKKLQALMFKAEVSLHLLISINY